ncbi:MAG: protein translocase subunit SecD, partial [Methylophilaceae bacterium]
MNQFSRWKNTLILLIVVFAVFYALPNFFGEAPAVQIMPIKSGEKMDPIIASQSENILEENNIPYNGVVLTENYIKIKLTN